MRNKKYHLLPYETIVKAATGEPEAPEKAVKDKLRASRP